VRGQDRVSRIRKIGFTRASWLSAQVLCGQS